MPSTLSPSSSLPRLLLLLLSPLAAGAGGAADACNASGLWHSVGSTDTITVAEAPDGALVATAASRGFVDAPGRVYANGTLLFLDCCVAGGIGGIFVGAAPDACAEIAWADGSATRWTRAAPARARAPAPAAAGASDRRAVVARYPQLTSAPDATTLDPADVFTLGNGDFAFNVDATGLQTFNSSKALQGPALDMNTFSSWAFHSAPAVADGTADGRNAALRSFNWTTFPTPTGAHTVRPITLATDNNLTGPFREYSMSNPHRVGLGQLALRVLPPGAPAGFDPPEADWQTATQIRSSLDTWAGAFSSSFTLAPLQGADPFCGATGEGGAITLQCVDSAATIEKVLFASYGAPLAACPSPVVNATCSAANSTSVVEALCLGKNACSVPSGDGYWGDPCRWVPKQLVIQAHCSSGGGLVGATAAAAASAAAALRVRRSDAVMNSEFACARKPALVRMISRTGAPRSQSRTCAHSRCACSRRAPTRLRARRPAHLFARASVRPSLASRRLLLRRR